MGLHTGLELLAKLQEQQRQSVERWYRSHRPLSDGTCKPPIRKEKDVYSHKTHQGHTFPILSLSFSPDCKTLASCSTQVLITDVPTGRLLAVLDSGSGSLIRAVRYSPNGSNIVTASDDCSICLWNVANLMRLGVPEGHGTSKPPLPTSSAATCNYNPSRASSANASPASTTPQSKLARSASISSTTLHQQQHERLQSSSAAALQEARKFLVPELAKVLMQCLVGHRKPVTAVAFTPDGRTLISVALDSTVRLWDLLTGAATHTLRGHTGDLHAVAACQYKDHSIHIFSGGADAEIMVWASVSNIGGSTKSGNLSARNYAGTSKRDGSKGSKGSKGSREVQVDTGGYTSGITWTCTAVLRGHKAAISNISSPANDCNTLVSGSWDGSIRVWQRGAMCDTHNEPLWSLLRVLAGVHTGPYGCLCVAISDDGLRMLSGGYDAAAVLWEVETGKRLECVPGHRAMVAAVALASDGKGMASASRDGPLVVSRVLAQRVSLRYGKANIAWGFGHPEEGRKLRSKVAWMSTPEGAAESARKASIKARAAVELADAVAPVTYDTRERAFSARTISSGFGELFSESMEAGKLAAVRGGSTRSAFLSPRGASAAWGGGGASRGASAEEVQRSLAGLRAAIQMPAHLRL